MYIEKYLNDVLRIVKNGKCPKYSDFCSNLVKLN